MKKTKLGVQGVFAVSSAVLLVGGGLAVLKDFNPYWKPFQKEFRELTLDLAAEELETANARVEAVYKSRLAELDSRIRELTDDARSVNNLERIEAKKAEIADLTQTEYEISQKLSFAKSDLGAYRSKYEFLKNDPYALESDIEKFGALYHEKFDLVQDLTPEADAAFAALTTAKDQLKELEKGAADVRRDRERIEAEMIAWRAEVERIDPKSPANLAANIVRDLPLLDFIDPKFNLKQIVLNGYPDITGSPKVDRCTTCHLGISDERYSGDDVPLVYRTHPKLDLYLGMNSPHPIEEFACTTCHLGRGYGTTFTLAAHSPNDEEQKKEWKKKYDWKDLHYWDYPMLPKKNMQAMCFSCHPNTYNLTMAEDLYEGRKIYERRGCHGCHKIEGLSEDMKKVGPSLKRVAAKLDPEWTERWIEAPREFYESARMPHPFGHQIPSDETFPEMLHHLPHDAAHELEPQHEKMVREDAVMIDAATAWLFANSEKEFEKELDPLPAEPGDPQIGKELVRTVNCIACHNLADLEASGQDYGPDLSKVGSKTTQRWLFNWLRNPKKYWADGNMPDPRLTDEEANHISAYLAGLKDEAFFEKERIEPTEELLYEIAERYKRAKKSEAQAKSDLAAMTPEQVKLYVGEETLIRRGCFACHDIAGMEKRPPVGVALNGEGFKAIELFDFGTHKFVHIEHSRHSWIEQKVKQPYIYFLGKVQNPYEQSFYMPWFGFDEKEAAQITTFVMAQTGVQPPAAYRFPEAIADDAERQRQESILEGAKIVERKNCVGCHPVGVGWKYLEGAELGENPHTLWAKDPVVAVADPNLPEDRYAEVRQLLASEGPAEKDRVLIPAEGFMKGDIKIGEDYFGATEIFQPDPIEVNVGATDEIRIPLDRPTSVRAYGDGEAHIHKYYPDIAIAPPFLRNQGAKTNPEWFFSFLKHVTPVRNHLGNLRMPQWEWSDHEAEAVVRYFAAAADEPYPYETVHARPYGEAHDKVARDLFGLPGTEEYVGSLKCLSCHPSGGLIPTSAQENWGPDLYLSRKRLKIGFLKSWLKDPLEWMPGTRMPRFFYDSDAGEYFTVRDNADAEIEDLAEMIYHLPDNETVKAAAALDIEFGTLARDLQARAMEAEAAAAAAAAEAAAPEASDSGDEGGFEEGGDSFEEDDGFDE